MPSHQTLYTDTITSKTDGSSVNIADSQGLFVTGDITTLGKTKLIGGRLELDNFKQVDFKNIAGAVGYGQIFVDNAVGTYAGPDGMAFYLNGAGRMAIKSDGNVGIGTANPTLLLQVEKSWGAMAVPLVHLRDSNDGYVFKVSVNAARSDMPLMDVENSGGSVFRIRGDGNVGIGTANPVNKLSVTSGVATITKSASDDDKYRPIITGGSKASVPDNVQTSLFQSGYDAVFTLHLVAFIDENNQMSKVYNVHVLFGSPAIAEISSHSWGIGVSSINIAYVNADRTIRATVDTAAQSTNVYWSVYGLGYRAGDGTFNIQ